MKIWHAIVSQQCNGLNGPVHVLLWKGALYHDYKFNSFAYSVKILKNQFWSIRCQWYFVGVQRYTLEEEKSGYFFLKLICFKHKQCSNYIVYGFKPFDG